MSLSNPTLTNPAEHFFEWKGGEGKLQFYDKEKQTTVNIPLPFSFIVLDELHTVTGYSDQDQSGFWSNEVRNIREDFTVRTKRGVKYVGPYKSDQGIVQVPQGARYTKSIYIAHPTKSGDWIMGNLKLAGAALTAWIEFSKQHSVSSGKVTITSFTEGSKGATKFKIPTFTWSKWVDEEYNTAIELDRKLQGYLTQYLNAPKYDADGEPINPNDLPDETATPEQQADFERRKQEAGMSSEPLPDFPEDLGEPINIDDIPF